MYDIYVYVKEPFVTQWRPLEVQWYEVMSNYVHIYIYVYVIAHAAIQWGRARKIGV